MSLEKGEPATRRDLLAGGASLLSAVAILSASSRDAQARDYASRREALDDIDRLAAICATRVSAVRRSRSGADVLATRFLAALQKHRSVREDVRLRFALPKGAEPSSPESAVDGDLPGLRQALDDLMIALAESLPVFGDSKVVSTLALDMVEVSRLRTVVDLWVESEAA